MVWQTGQRLQGGKFEIIEILGQGGFGITYKARNRVLEIDVVIKTPNTLQRRDSEYDQYIQQFQEEGRNLARFSANPHPHIVRVWDIFLEDQVPCLVMDFIQGQTLMEKVKTQGRLSESECLRYIRQIGDALVTVHQAGFVHRDAHPGNIMIQSNGKAILIDFGIAKNIIPATRSSTNNAANLSFAPYEQIYKGSNASREPNVDVYSLAATFYYAVTGQLPTPSMERRLDNRPLIPPQQINRQLSGHINDAIVLGMALEKENRPQSMSAWLQQLDPTPPPVPRQYQKEVVNHPQVLYKVVADSRQSFASKQKNLSWLVHLHDLNLLAALVSLVYCCIPYLATGAGLGSLTGRWFAARWIIAIIAAGAFSWTGINGIALSTVLLVPLLSWGGVVLLILSCPSETMNMPKEAAFFYIVIFMTIFITVMLLSVTKLRKIFSPLHCFSILAFISFGGLGIGCLLGFLASSGVITKN